MIFDYDDYNDDYYTLGLPKKKLEELLGTLTGCEACNSTYDREDDRNYFYEPDENFESLLDDIGFTDAQKETIYNNIKCPNCHCDLDGFSQVTINEYYKEEKSHKNYIEKIASNAETKIKNFYDYIIKYPYLGCNHKVGKQIIKNIETLEKISIDNKIFYRAREPKNSEIFTCNHMLPPSPEMVPISEGRFNHYGQSHWYLGDSIEICGAECTHRKNCMLWFQKITIKKADNIMDLTQDYIHYYYNPLDTKMYEIPITLAALLLSGILQQEQTVKGYWKPEYFVTRFIADVCKTKGINGILYPSSLYPAGKNLVIFDINKIDFEFEAKPELKEYIYKTPADQTEVAVF
ncbi:MAG: RES family NAD+ phosphorylase [Treponema sp.]|nr:RES family NAD+ phosphorylase [Treponema sp.]